MSHEQESTLIDGRWTRKGWMVKMAKASDTGSRWIVLVALVSLVLGACGDGSAGVEEPATTPPEEVGEEETADTPADDGVATTATSVPDAEGSDGEPIKIGVLLEFTGTGAQYGALGREMIELTLETRSSEIAGRPIEVLYEDTETDPGTAVEKAQKLIERDNADIVIGPTFTDSEEAVAPYLASQGVLGMPFLGGAYSLGEGRNMISYPGSTDSFCIGLGDWAANDAGFSTMETLGADYSGGHQLITPVAEEFETHGGEVLQQQWAAVGTVDFAPFMAELEGAEALVIFSVMPDYLAIMQQFYELGPDDTELVLCEADAVTPSQLEEVGEDIVGAHGIISGYSTEVDTPQNEAFVEAVQEAYGREPDIADGSAYISFNILLDGLEANGGDPTLDTLYETIINSTMETAMGPVTFTDNGFTASNRYIATVSDTFRWDPVQTFEGVVDPRDK